MIIVIFILLLYVNTVHPANWAQTSGELQQNTVVPFNPAPSTKHWAARYGHATVGIKVQAGGVNSNVGSMFLLGGDTYDGDITQRNFGPGLVDNKWSNGYKNDVWVTVGTEWYVKGDLRLRVGERTNLQLRYNFRNKLPEVRSKMDWQLLNPGANPKPKELYDDWIICEEVFRQARYFEKRKELCKTFSGTMWSPRRHHVAVVKNNYIYVMGGRAREFVELPDIRSVGGIVGAVVADVPVTKNTKNQLLTTQREASVLKNDVWRSNDGITWVLVNPGCKRPQPSLIARGNKRQGKYGDADAACTQDTDCYGSEYCDTQKLTCTCSLWSPRESHAVATDNTNIYVFGGFVSRLYSEFSNCGAYSCGDRDASAYRSYMSDLWRSSDGEQWIQITESARAADNTLVPGRGGHSMVYYPFNDNKGKFLFIFGGRSSIINDDVLDHNKQENIGDTQYLNDIWRTDLSKGDGSTWELVPNNALHTWEPRMGHTVTLETPSPSNGYTSCLYLIGGQGYDNTTFFDDVWTWRPEVKNDYWRKDYESDSLFSTGDGKKLKYANNTPASYYVSPVSPITSLRRFWIDPRAESKGGDRSFLRPYLTEDRIAMLHETGIFTINDLAVADKYKILKLRGFDYPQIPLEKRMNFYDICDVRELAIRIVSKCNINKRPMYAGENQMPWNVEPVFGGPPPAVTIDWHGITGYDFLLPEIDDPVVLTETWDACTYRPQIQGLFGPNINGLGIVDQVVSIRDPLPELQELTCKQYPGTRAFHSSIYFEERLYIFGGKKTEQQFWGDTWYRDAKFPTTRFKHKPLSNTPDPIFQFVADEPGVTFEYRLWDPYNYMEVKSWSPCVQQTDIGWLDWREGGPSNNFYTIYVRAVDPAGNKDEKYEWDRNIYTWYYVSPTPWDIIAEVVMSFLGLCFFGYLEYRRRVKKAAMERYAMKRMRRKFKAMQRDMDGKAMDWRTLYLESQTAVDTNAKKKEEKRKARLKKQEKREKDRDKKEKEKERIKKKLKQARDFKDKTKSKGSEDKKEDKKDKDKKKKKKGEEEEEEVDLSGVPLIDVKAEKAAAKAKVLAEQEAKYKDEEVAGGLVAKEGGGDGKKFKDYENPALKSAPEAPGGGDNLEEGTKSRKQNKRFKEYELEGQGGGDNQAKKNL